MNTTALFLNHIYLAAMLLPASAVRDNPMRNVTASFRCQRQSYEECGMVLKKFLNKVTATSRSSGIDNYVDTCRLMRLTITTIVLCGLLANPVIASNLRLFINRVDGVHKYYVEYLSKITLDQWRALQSLTHSQYKEILQLNSRNFAVHGVLYHSRFNKVSDLELTDEELLALQQMHDGHWHGVIGLIGERWESDDELWEAFKELSDDELMAISKHVYKKRVVPIENKRKLANGISSLLDFLTRVFPD